MNITSAKKSIKFAAGAGFLQAAFLAVVITVVMILNTDFLGVNPLGYIDAVIFAFLAFGVFKKSRTCAIILLVYFILGQGITLLLGGSLAGIPLALLFLYIYIQGIRGTFAYHKESDDTVSS
ncbi:hypothetical protein [Virgibacillus doumboii]|uniref:hypothetical protein n=1 Tax=Virgibacillus doumboii TaxID=2697503 RepID=UPI0013E0E005|nr:hypothetical protein [Virgibacillus doumboii]